MRRKKGFSLLELAVATAVFGIIALSLFNRFLYYQEAAEKAAMEYTISALKSGLQMRMADLIMEGRAQEIVSLLEQNPLDWLQEKPSGYLGKMARPEAANIPPGSWFYDVDTREVGYLPMQTKNLNKFPSGNKFVRLKLVPVKNMMVNSASVVEASPTDSVRLIVVEPYDWL